MDAPRDTPYFWWGDAWSRPNPWSLEELVAGGLIAPSQAGQVVDHVERGGSVVVVSARSGSGKSTFAHALIDCCPPDRRRIYVRGNQEAFAWTKDIQPETTTLLVNEISHHLPIYLWGAGLRAVLHIVRAGAQVLVTAHAHSAADLLESLVNTGLSSNDVVALGLVVALDETRRTASGLCPIGSIEHLAPLDL